MKMNWNQHEVEERKPRTPEEVRQAFALLFGKEYIAPSDSDPQDCSPSATRPEINFPELEIPAPTLSLQQIKPDENPAETGYPPVETGIPEPKTARSPHEPKRGPRGFLNELPEPTQQKILDLLEDNTTQEVIDILAQPAPTGLGRRITEQTLRRFKNRHNTIEQRAEIAGLSAAAAELISDPNTTDADLTNASLRIVRACVLEYANDIQNFDALERINNVLHKLRRADQIDRRQTYLERGKSEPNPERRK